MSEEDQALNNMLHDLNINEMMIEEGENIHMRLRSIFKFFEKRIKHYNIEIQILTSKILNLRKNISYYNNIIEEYRNDIERQQKVDSLECKLCKDSLSNCVMEPCKHLVCCYECFEKLEEKKCPVCRVEFTNCLRIYY